VARDAAERLEKLVAREFLGCYGIRFARKPAVKAAAGRSQGALVSCNGIQQGGNVGRTSVGITELPHHRRVGAKLAHSFLRARHHGRGIEQTLLDFGFKRTTLPSQFR
jgi:hypothetical protein